MAVTTIRILEAVERSQAKDEAKVARVVTFENPPETNHPFAGSAYYLPEVVKWISGARVEFADFNNCVYADPAKGEPPFKKPHKGSWASCLASRSSLRRAAVDGGPAIRKPSGRRRETQPATRAPSATSTPRWSLGSGWRHSRHLSGQQKWARASQPRPWKKPSGPGG